MKQQKKEKGNIRNKQENKEEEIRREKLKKLLAKKQKVPTKQLTEYLNISKSLLLHFT